MDETFPDLSSLTDQELKDLIQQLSERSRRSPTVGGCCTARSTSCARSSSTACADATTQGEDIFSGADVERLTDILAGRAAAAAEPDAGE